MPQGALIMPSVFEAAEKLSDEEELQLLRAICIYFIRGEEMELPGVPGLMFSVIKPCCVSSLKRYAAAVENGKKGGRPKKKTKEKTSALEERNQYLDLDSDIDIDSDLEINLDLEMASDMDLDFDKEEDSPQKKSKKKSSPDIFFSFACGDEILLKALRDFEEMRRLKKKPLTDRAKELLCNKLKTFPPEEREATLLQSIEHGWDTVYPLHGEDGQGTDNPFLKMMEEL